MLCRFSSGVVVTSDGCCNSDSSRSIVSPESFSFASITGAGTGDIDIVGDCEVFRARAIFRGLRADAFRFAVRRFNGEPCGTVFSATVLVMLGESQY